MCNARVLSLLIILFFSTELSSGKDSLSRRVIPNFIYGITTDDGYDLVELPDSIRSLSRRVCTRIVFDEDISAREYIAGTTAIQNVSCVMGLVADSSTISSYTPESYAARFREYFDLLSDKVDIWEIGNEVNGSWTGPSAVVSHKINIAFDLARSRGLTTALTLYYNTPCVLESEREMFHWSKENLSERVRQGVDYLLISYYEDDCPGSQQDWNKIFQRLAQQFPNSKVGFGEIGTANENRKQELIKRYYELSLPGAISEPRFIGGYFYWYFREDMVPKTKPLWSYFNAILARL